jgi:hypothetical protein
MYEAASYAASASGVLIQINRTRLVDPARFFLIEQDPVTGVLEIVELSAQRDGNPNHGQLEPTVVHGRLEFRAIREAPHGTPA